MNRKMREEEKEEKEEKEREEGEKRKERRGKGRRRRGRREEERKKGGGGKLRGAGPQAPPKIAFLEGLQASPGCFLCVFELLLVQSFFW